MISKLETCYVSTNQLSFDPNTEDRAVYRVQFRLNLAGFFTHMPNLRVDCGITIRNRDRDSDRNTRAQCGRMAADTPEQILFVGDFRPNFAFVRVPQAFPFKSVNLSYNMHCTVSSYRVFNLGVRIEV